MEINVKLEISQSGRTMRLTLPDNGRVIAELLIHGPLKRVIDNCINGAHIMPGRANIYRAEAYGLAGYEHLDMDNEVILEK